MGRAVVISIAVLVLLGAASAAWAQDVDCAMCHPEKAQGKSVHPVVAMGCTSCHTAVDASAIPHKMTSGAAAGLMSEGSALCFVCHDKGKFSGGKAVHMPVAGGMCTGCHDPHASGFEKLLLSDNVCFNCHARADFASKNTVHAPVAGGMCTGCHVPHQSAGEKLLKAAVPPLCYTCHDSKKFYGPTLHSPVALGVCNGCHAPHQSDSEKLLVAPMTELCFNCHDKGALTGNVTHKPVSEGECTGCHKPHVSQNENLLIRKGNILCRSCHPAVERQPHGIVGFSAKGHPLRARRDPKRPGKTFGCLSCHLPHSSESPSLFRYKANSMFDLCSHCHEKF